MGCDIHTVAERLTADGFEPIDFVPFDWRSYGMYAFLAGVRNYSDIQPIAEPRGLPDGYRDPDDDPWLGDHSYSWLTIEELAAFDYDQSIEDRRVGRRIAPNAWSGAVTAEPGGGEMTTYREFLGEGFFNDLKALQEAGAARIVFGFDN